ncbi:MAG: CRTAC1 family protein [Pseudomonadota bacterium]|nr:CRTAC1 family protein [Pseudomonadota bacterium]
MQSQFRVALTLILAPFFSASLVLAEINQPIGFDDISDSSGVVDLGVNSTGPTFVDFDNDGDIDIYVTVETHSPGQSNRLWQNNGKGQFTDVAKTFAVDDYLGLARGASWGDIDNDGDADLAVGNLPNTGGREFRPTGVFKNLLIETGSPNFEEITQEARFFRKGNRQDKNNGGMTDTSAGLGWADYNNDGYLDLYVRIADYDIDNVLFRSNGNGTFKDVTKSSGVSILDKVLEANSQGSPTWTDINHDGFIDMLVTNEGDSNILFLNNRKGSFVDITNSRKQPSGLAFLNPGNANGACVADIDNDGDMDFYLPTADQANRLIISEFAETGKVSFKDITLTSGAADLRGARGCVMADFDNDGLIDIYVNNGGLSNVLINDVIGGLPVFVQFYIAWEPDYNTLLRNNGDRTFSDVTDGSGAEGYGIGSGVGAADINDDGFPDLYVANRTYYSMDKRVGKAFKNQLLLNKPNENNWVRVLLQGTDANRDGYGARVKVVAGELVQYREHTSSHGYNSGNDPRLLFGLGQKEQIDLIEVTWPGGQKQIIENQQIGRTIKIVQQSSS